MQVSRGSYARNIGDQIAPKLIPWYTTAFAKMGKELSVGYHAVLGGASFALRESMGALLFALALGICIAYMVPASQFNSFLHPITVLTALPLSSRS